VRCGVRGWEGIESRIMMGLFLGGMGLKPWNFLRKVKGRFSIDEFGAWLPYPC